MADEFCIGQRLSFEGALCSVRYIGPVEGRHTDAIWLGVEWDDTKRGKHSGEHQSRRYFHCRSAFPTAASFVRSTRLHDQPLSFIQALRSKYGREEELVSRHRSGDTPSGQSTSQSIVFSGKVVEEVGFDKVSQQLASFSRLRIVLLDGLCLAAANRKGETLQDAQKEIRDTCPNILELDLSRNLLENWQSVIDMCQPLDRLRVLRLNGNRFQTFEPAEPVDSPFSTLQELYLEDCLLDWDQISLIFASNCFPNLRHLSLSRNGLNKPPRTFASPLVSLRELDLDFNGFTNLSDLDTINQCFPHLETLSVQDNQISSFSRSASNKVTFPCISTLGLSRNNITTWTFLDELNSAMPALRTLRIITNRLFDETTKPDAVGGSLDSSFSSQRDSPSESSFMTTIARLGNITSLNYSNITPQDRMNGELYYLAQIGRELDKAPIERILALHPRYLELCKKYDREPTMKGRIEDDKAKILTDSWDARLVNLKLYRTSSVNDGVSEHQRAIPKSVDIYRLKGLVSRTFGLPPLSFRLIYESDTLDEIVSSRSKLNAEEWDRISLSTDGKIDRDQSRVKTENDSVSNFKKKETELVDSTRELSHFLESDARNINIRIELK